MTSRNKLHTNIVNKHGVKIEIIKDHIANRGDAVNKEVMLQMFFRPRACFQYGDGNKKIVSDETRAKLSKAHRGHKYNLGRKNSDEVRARMSAAQKGIPRTHKTTAGLVRPQSVRDAISRTLSVPVINCRGQIFKSGKEAAEVLGLNTAHGIYRNIKGINKWSGKYPDGNKIQWKHYINN